MNEHLHQIPKWRLNIIRILTQIAFIVNKRRNWCGTHQTEKVQATVALFSAFAALDNLIRPMELSLLNRDVDPDDILPDDAASTDVQVAENRNPSMRSPYTQTRDEK